MDTDFHFGTIYVLSHWAGFEHDNCLALATASQLVDDNMQDIVGDAPRYSGHDITENITDASHNNDIWIPYHFLPGLEGDENDRLICKKNGILAQKLASIMENLGTLDNNVNLFRLGISLHVYADTWAHQEFSGNIDHDNNNVSNLDVSFPGISNWEREKQGIIEQLPPLGHAKAYHWPDRPYASWSYYPDYVNDRQNWNEFLEASCSIYSILAKVHGGVSLLLTDTQKEQLLNAFKKIICSDYDARNWVWIDRIKTGFFGFTEDFNPIHNPYTPSLIINDPDFRPSFYQALDDHYNWVKNELIDAGLDILH
jgi:hypothetical protein